MAALLECDAQILQWRITNSCLCFQSTILMPLCRLYHSDQAIKVELPVYPQERTTWLLNKSGPSIRALDDEENCSLKPIKSLQDGENSLN